MAVTLALPSLYSAIGARLASEAPLVGDPPAPVPIAVQWFGWREPARQHIGNRFVWVPGEPDGKVGDLGPPRFPGTRAEGRPLWNMPEAFHVYITGYDATAPENELLQYTAARLLLDEFARLLYLCAYGTLGIPRVSWYSGGKKEFRAGATLLLVCSVQSVQPDTEATPAPADAGAIVDIEMLDLTEELRIPEDHVPTVP